MRKYFFFIGLGLLLAACNAGSLDSVPGIEDDRMTSRHQAAIPNEYAGLTNPIPPDASSLERGASLYATNCARCHGDSGMGDGPSASALDPAPAPVAHTSQILADDYLFWRISEGGATFGTSMPAWKILDEQSRWDMINYLHAIGAGM